MYVLITHFSSHRGADLGDMKTVVIQQLRSFVFGLAADVPSSSAIQDISDCMQSPPWVRGPTPASMLEGWLVPANIPGRRGQYRSVIGSVSV